jgi:chromosomal replication initiation ATPase DnaA
MPLQLPLPFEHQPSYEPSDFIAACSNHDALVWLDALWPDQRLALFGPPGCGKSHMLHIWQQRTGAVLLSGPTLTDLDQIPIEGALALDEADTIADETLLLHLLNIARDRDLRLLFTGRNPPARWPIHLPDLSSRLRAITAVEILPPGDELLAALLKRLVADRQVAMSQPAQDWVLHHLPRSAAALREAVALLDRESLASGVAITRSLAVKVLNQGAFHVPETDPETDEEPMSQLDPSSPPPSFL